MMEGTSSNNTTTTSSTHNELCDSFSTNNSASSRAAVLSSAASITNTTGNANSLNLASMISNSDSGSFVVVSTMSSDKKPPTIPRNNTKQRQQPHHPSSIEEAAASLAASMGLLPIHNPGNNTINEPLEIPNKQEVTNTTSTYYYNKFQQEQQQHNSTMPFVKVEFPRPLFFGNSIPATIRKELSHFEESSSSLSDHNSLSYRSFLQTKLAIQFYQKEYLYTFTPAWDNSWDRLYSKQSCWDFLVQAQTATSSSYFNTTSSHTDSPVSASTEQQQQQQQLVSLDVTAHTPLYGCDDTSLPTVADLGQFDTNQEQTLYQKDREIQMSIDTVFPEVYRISSIRTTNPSHHPDDSTSWNNRTVNVFNNPPSLLPKSPQPDTSANPNTNVNTSPTRFFDTNTSTANMNTTTPSTQQTDLNHNDGSNSIRIGWWNNTRNPTNNTNDNKGPDPILVSDTSSRMETSSTTPCWIPPSVDILKSHNLPLSLLHNSFGYCPLIPFVADRPPSWRYLQIDTQSVGFATEQQQHPQIEPLFCTMAIYHVEPVLMANSNTDYDGGSISRGGKNSTSWRFSIPKSGRVTEALRFDVVGNEEIELDNSFQKSLWPYHVLEEDNIDQKDRLQGTRVGIFPLPSNLDIANLHAVLIVHKVVSDDTDLEPYIATPAATTKQKNPLERLQSRAQKTANKLGLFLSPFAFGVAPLLKAIGEEVPTSVPTSRAVQIPLFKLDPGKGEIPIFEHIINLRYPRSSSDGVSESTSSTCGGKAMLVMRNFGYLSLPCAIDIRSSLAKDRVVDFSCERQIIRNHHVSDKEEEKKSSEEDWNTVQALSLPPWKEKYIAEPAKRGGRSSFNFTSKLPEVATIEKPDSQQQNQQPSSYAQELAPIPISMTTPYYLNPGNHNSSSTANNYHQRLMVKPPPSSSSSSLNSPNSHQGGGKRQHLRTNSGESGLSLNSSSQFGSPQHQQQQQQTSSFSADAEPMWHSSICNELLLHPRFIDNCSKSKQNLCISVEIRKLALLENTSGAVSLVALPLSQPHIHNPRRGPWLVTTAFSSCAYHVANPHFIDEFKLKLPAVLEPGLVVYCNVYNLSVKGKKTLSTMFSGYSSGKVVSKDSSNKPPRGLEGTFSRWKQQPDSCMYDEPDQFMKHSSKGKMCDSSIRPTSDDVDNETSSEFYQASIQSWLASPHVDLLGSGILPLTHLTGTRNHTNERNLYLIANGSHDINICYAPKALNQFNFPDSNQTSAADPNKRKEKSGLLMTFGGGGKRTSASTTNQSMENSLVSFGFSKSAVDKQQQANSILPPSMAADELPRYTFDNISKLPEGTVVLRLKSNTTTSVAADGAGITYLENNGADFSASASWDQDEALETSPRSLTRSTSNHSLQSPKSTNMILQMRTVSLSTLHQQNTLMAELLGPSLQVISSENIKEEVGDKSPEEKYDGFVTETERVDAQGSNSDDAEESPQEAALISLLTDLTKTSQCPCIEHVLHFHRVTSQLLFFTLLGPSGKYDPFYCDPRSLTPLRLHAFSTLLNIWWQLVLFVQKCGVKQLDGRRKWNIYMLAKTVGLMWFEYTAESAILEKYYPDMEEDNLPNIIGKISQVEAQSQVEILPVVQEESASFSQAEATSSVASDIPEAEGKDGVDDKTDIMEPPSLRKNISRPLKLKRQVTPFPPELSNSNSNLFLQIAKDRNGEKNNAKKETDESFFLKDAEIQPSPVIDDDMFRKLLGGDTSAETFDEFVPLAAKKDALDSEVINKTDSVAPKRRHRHNRTITPMGNIADMLQSAEARENSERITEVSTFNSFALPNSKNGFGSNSFNEEFILESIGNLQNQPSTSTSEAQNKTCNDFPEVLIYPSTTSSHIAVGTEPLLPSEFNLSKEASLRPPTPKPQLDSKFDFQNLLKQASLSPVDRTEGFSEGNDDLLTAKLSVVSSIPLSSGRRKWMTLPNVSMLATIEEDIEGEDSKSPLIDFGMRKKICDDLPILLAGTSPSVASEGPSSNSDATEELHFATRVTSKQFRIPRKSGGTLPDTSGNEAPCTVGLQDPSAYGMKLENETGNSATGPPGYVIEPDKQSNQKSRGQRRRPPNSSNDRPMTDDEIESAGTAFLDMIGKNLGLGIATKDMGGEERPVGHSHHRKTESRCSIDWTLPPPDLILQNRQIMDLHARGQFKHDEEASGNTSSDDDEEIQNSFALEATETTKDGVALTQDMAFINKITIPPHPLLVGEEGNISVELSPLQVMRNGTLPILSEDGGAVSKNNDGNSSVYTAASTAMITNSFFKNAALAASFPQAKYLKLPGYDDRRKTSPSPSLYLRPFAYEVILYTWVALLLEQTKSSDSSGGVTPITSGARKRATMGRNSQSMLVSASETVPSKALELPQPLVSTTSKQLQKHLTEKASKAKGVTISCAPILFEVIKKSLAERIHNLLKQRQQLGRPGSNDTANTTSPVLATLDPGLLVTLETLVQLITDACIDSRNFDSNSFRQTSSDVNDSMVIFLRDLYSLIHPAHVHKLLCVYFSRYILKEGKHWSNRDSKIGLRCAWETCKFRLNAVTLLIRFPDFSKVNSPIFGQIDSGRHSRKFYSQLLEYIERDLSIMSPFAATESQPSVRKRPANTTLPTQGGGTGSTFIIPPYQPHCFAELVIDICLTASGHTEQSIQHRASSLVSELFWMHQLEGKANGTLAAIGSMYITYVPKLLDHLDHLACLPAKSQLRKDLLPPAIFVMQAAPSGLLSALWRKLIRRTVGKGSSTSTKQDAGGGVSRTRSNSIDSHLFPPPIDASSLSGSSWDKTEVTMDEDDKPCIIDVFCLLNLSLKTLEYEGAEIEEEPSDQLASWQKEFVYNEENSSTTASRKWHAHDGAVVIINTARCIVHETLYLLRPHSTDNGGSFSNDLIAHTPLHLSDVMPSASFSGPRRGNEKTLRKKRRHAKYGSSSDGSFIGKSALNFSVSDTVLFVRATSSVYLHALSLRTSDSVLVKTLTGAIELLKIFGVKLFLSAVGETLQHWMRVVLMCGGARRANVRIQALDFLAVLLRLTWDSHGSLSRVRVPILATLTEVMERTVATAAACHYREQRKLGKLVEHLSNDAAEASLCPLWRTLDRLHHQSASQNAAFKDSLSRLAEMMKRLYRAYIAAHSLAVADRMKANAVASKKGNIPMPNDDPIRNDKLHRLTALSAGFSRQFLGTLSTPTTRRVITNDEALEEVFLAAANVFSPMELPLHRVGWLRRLSEFHKSRGKPAEEASCHLSIHATLQQAARAHACLWFSVPFLPWTTDSLDGINFNGEGAVGGSVQLGGDFDDLEDSMNEYDSEVKEEFRGIQHVEKTASFRRLFRRAANSVQIGRGDWETYGNRHSFYGVANLYDYEIINCPVSLREIEEEMIEEAETAGDLFLTAGIIQSSRLSWSAATQFYAENFNFARLAYCYRRLSSVVASQVPVVDTNSAHELSSPLGRFYKVYFHGSAPDELVGKEFVYRTAVDDQIEAFGKRISNILESLLQEGTPIDLTLDDGRAEESSRKRPTQRVRVAPIRINGQNREMGPCQIKITPLRPILQGERHYRGSAEWFFKQSEMSRSPSAQVCAETRSIASSRVIGNAEEGSRHTAQSPHHRAGKRFTTDIDRLGSVPLSFTGCSTDPQMNAVVSDSGCSHLLGGGKEMTGVDMFTFTRPVRKDKKGSREWFKNVGDLAEKSLRVSQFQVENCFPCCVSRQAVVDRTKLVYYQSPLEAGIEAVCSWCSVLFRTAVSINGQAVLAGTPLDHIGPSAEKVLADCIFLCKVKELGVALLSTNTGYAAEFDDDETAHTGIIGGRHGRLTEEEVVKFQHTLARSIGIYLELLHLLIARNRDLLLVVVKTRKNEERQNKMSNTGYPPSPGSVTRASRSYHRKIGSGMSLTSHSVAPGEQYSVTDDGDHMDTGSISSGYRMNKNGNEKIDAAIAVQSELQRAFISQAKILYPIVSNVLYSETPRWLKACTQDGYFSSGAYRHTRISMEEEIFFYDTAASFSGEAQRSPGGLETVPSDSASMSWENPSAPLYDAPARSFSPTNASYSGAGSVTSKTSEASKRRRGLRSPAHSTASSKHYI